MPTRRTLSCSATVELPCARRAAPRMAASSHVSDARPPACSGRGSRSGGWSIGRVIARFVAALSGRPRGCSLLRASAFVVPPARGSLRESGARPRELRRLLRGEATDDSTKETTDDRSRSPQLEPHEIEASPDFGNGARTSRGRTGAAPGIAPMASMHRSDEERPVPLVGVDPPETLPPVPVAHASGRRAPTSYRSPRS